LEFRVKSSRAWLIGFASQQRVWLCEPLRPLRFFFSGVLGFANLFVLCGFFFSSVLGFANLCVLCGFFFGGLLGFSVFFFSGVLGYACPVSEIGANLCGRRLCAVVYGSILEQRAWFSGKKHASQKPFSLQSDR
jgi:hypothetical protein